MKRFSFTYAVSALMLTFTVLSSTSCSDNEPDNSPTITVASQSGQDVSLGTDGTADFKQDADRLQISVNSSISTEYVLKVSGDSDWLFVDEASGSFTAGQSKTITLYANRRGLDPGIHNCKLIVSTPEVEKEIPVSIDITEFAPFGYCRKFTSCDSRLPVQFRGCYKRNGYVTLEYRITNNGADIKGLKLWQHPTKSYFTDNGTRYDTQNGGMTSVLGSQSGIGDLMTPVRSGETIKCSHTFYVGDKIPSGSLSAHMLIHNYGTGDWDCTGEYVDFYDLECEDLDNFNPDYRPKH